jgi:hypothetical protein
MLISGYSLLDKLYYEASSLIFHFRVDICTVLYNNLHCEHLFTKRLTICQSWFLSTVNLPRSKQIL